MKRGETVTTPQKRKNIAMEGEKQTQPAFTCPRLKIETLEQNLKKKKLYGPFFMDGGQLPQGHSHFEEAVYFLPFKV